MIVVQNWIFSILRIIVDLTTMYPSHDQDIMAFNCFQMIHWTEWLKLKTKNILIICCLQRNNKKNICDNHCSYFTKSKFIICSDLLSASFFIIHFVLKIPEWINPIVCFDYRKKQHIINSSESKKKNDLWNKYWKFV